MTRGYKIALALVLAVGILSDCYLGYVAYKDYQALHYDPRADSNSEGQCP